VVTFRKFGSFTTPFDFPSRSSELKLNFVASRDSALAKVRASTVIVKFLTQKSAKEVRQSGPSAARFPFSLKPKGDCQFSAESSALDE
jgi:hypothetical protein